ncbi:MAG: ABC transporter ATP-binding protein [Nitrospirae bacterium GWC2_57_9]|nr:MAG: ABC transporter ATP-binding protein [Nitrospirae bacterium GWC2_57_9]
MIVIEDLRKNYGDRKVLDGVSFAMERRKITHILGTSGGGKSTLLKVMIGALKPDAGRIRYGDMEITNLQGRQLDPYRKKIGMLFQHGALINSLTVAENVGLPIREHTGLDDNIVKIMVKMKLEMVGLRDFEELYPAQLSGGMQKRVALARALALDPELVYFDEPTSGLDPIVASVITKLIADLNRLLGITCIVVTHAVEEAMRIADKIVILYRGKVLAQGTPGEIRESSDPLVQQFITGNPDGPISFRASSKDYREDLLIG